LPHTPLSIDLERCVREKVRQATSAEVAASIVVRVVSSLKKSILVPREVQTAFTVDAPDPATLVETVVNSDCLSATAVESVARGQTNGSVEPASASASASATASARSSAGAPRGSAAISPSDGRQCSEYASEYTYRQRVVLLFQRLDGTDVCLFALFVQEYGPDCPAPNARKVYIAYLDSVRYLRPISARTAAYHELLAAYLNNARRRGYDTCHIWGPSDSSRFAI
jgi:hypothetical protein